MNTYKVIDIDNWKRKIHCMAFRNSAKPTIGFTIEMDITNYKRKIKSQGLSFTMAMIYAICKTANEIEEFRYRFLDGDVILFDKIDTTFTYLDKETELFKVVYVPFTYDIKDYCEQAYRIANEQEEYFPKALRQDVFQCSPIPFMTYSAMSHTSSGKKENATPTFDWGKYYEKEDKTKIKLSLVVHHSFVDGLHVGRFVDKLQKFFDEY